MTSLFAGWMLGLVLGMRHALEADHLAAVSTFLAEDHGSRRAVTVGLWWGLGHALTLCVVGGLALLLRTGTPPWLTELWELGVALMLFALGGRAIVRAFTAARQGQPCEHRHGSRSHVHAGPRDHLHVGRWTLAWRPLLVGTAHGLAGSGALTVLALTAMPSLTSAAVYIVLFGIGSVAAMTMLTALAGLPLRRLTELRWAQPTLNGVAGTTSMAVGIVWALPAVMRLMESLPSTL